MRWKNTRKASFFKVTKSRLFFLLFVLFIGYLSYLFITSNVLTIKSTEVNFEKISCATSDQIQQSSNLLGQHIIFFDLAKSVNKLKSSFLCIKDVQIIRGFPDKVKIFVSGREAKAILLVLKNQEASVSAEVENIATPSARLEEIISNFQVDETGLIFSKEIKDSDRTKVYYNGEINLGQKQENITNALKILDKVKVLGLDVKETEILNDIFITYPQIIEDEERYIPRIVFKLSGNIDTQLASLQLILNKAKIDLISLRFVDLRFDKPIVKLAPNNK